MLTLVCPQCQASYQLPQAHFGPTGKKVRCASCAHVWVAHDDAPAVNTFENLLALAAVSDETAPGLAEPVAPDHQTGNNSFGEILAAAAAAAEPAMAPSLIAARDTAELGKPKLISAKRLNQARAQTAQNETDYGMLKVARWGSMATAAALLLLLTAGNHWVVQKIPGLLPFYNQLGLNPLPAASGLQFVNIRDDSAPEAEDKPLLIHGEIENLTDIAKPAPMLVLHITSPTGQTKQFVHNLHNQVIMPHETLAFSIERPHFAETGWQVDLRFE